MAYLMGIDVGTTSTRALIIDEGGRVVASAADEYPMDTPRPLWAEQDPSDWWRATCRAIREALDLSAIAPAAIAGLGLTGQMHGVVLLDGEKRVLRPAIIWCDQRSQVQCDWITQQVGAERLIELTCNPALTGFTLPKLLWIRDHELEVYERAAKLLLPKDYIRFLLTGVFASEVSDASGTLLFDVKGRRWSQEMLEAMAIRPELLPEVYESPAVSGHLSSEAARAIGLLEGTPVVGGGGDQAAGAVGNGVVERGLISSTIGTSGVVFAFADRPVLDPHGRVHTFCHALPGAWHVMGVTQGAGLSLRWFRDNFAGAEVQVGSLAGTDPYDLLTAEAARAQPGCEGLLFLPYLMGERTPHLDANAKGLLFGITARHSRFQVIRAILEGVAYSLRDSLEILKEMEVPITQVRASGGGGRSALWRQIQADVFGTEIVTINATEGPSYGAALLAGVGAGLFGSVEEACRRTIRVVERTKPIPENVRIYERFYPLYCSLYGMMKPAFDQVTELVSQR